jgi:putative flippase GtrA
LAFAGPPALVLSQLFSFSLAGFPLVILLFPDGRLPSRRWRWVVRAYVAVAAASVLAISIAILRLVIEHHVVLQASGNLESLGSGSTAWVDPVLLGFVLIVAVFWLAAIGRQGLSWRRSAGEHREQLKWLASGAAICGVFGIWAITTDSAIWEVLILGFAALPLSIGIGILKYRLYDIDRIISRTLSYAIVTGLLVGVYAGLVLLATQVLTVKSPVAVAASTLAAAALFNPVRHRVQRAVDRRFNRARYDADRTVAAFAARLKDAVDLDQVHDDLASVVRNALEPDHISLWVSDYE